MGKTASMQRCSNVVLDKSMQRVVTSLPGAQCLTENCGVTRRGSKTPGAPSWERGKGGIGEKEGESTEVPEPEENIRIRVCVERATNLPVADLLGKADPYVEIRAVQGDPLNAVHFEPKSIAKRKSKPLDAKTVFKDKTNVISKDLNPVWNQRFDFDVPYGDGADELFFYFRIFDSDLIGSDDFLGHLSIGLFESLAGGVELSVGRRAILRASGTRAKLDLLRSSTLVTRTAKAYPIKAVPGQEKKYDLKTAELFVSAEIVAKLQPEEQKFDEEERASRHKDLIRSVVGGIVPLAHRALEQGASVNLAPDSGEYTAFPPLHIACLKGYLDMAQVLVDVHDASLVLKAPAGRSAAMCACEAKEEDLAEWLVAEGVPVDLVDDSGRTVLFYAAIAGLPQLTGWLLSKKHIDVNTADVGGYTPLMAAATGGNAAVLQQLLEAKAKANQVDELGKNALMNCCQAGHAQCIKLLLNHPGIKKAAVDRTGLSALDFARSAGLPAATLAHFRSRGVPELPLGENDGEFEKDPVKREQRLKKAEHSDASHWRTWRRAAPRASVYSKARVGAGVGALESDEEGEIPDIQIQEEGPSVENTPRPGQFWSIGGDSGSRPVTTSQVRLSEVGPRVAHEAANPPAGYPEKQGLLKRLQRWGASIRKMESKS